MYFGVLLKISIFSFAWVGFGWLSQGYDFVCKISALLLSAWGKREGDVGYILSHHSLASSSCLQHASWAWCDPVIEWKVGVTSEVCLFMSEFAGLLCDSFH